MHTVLPVGVQQAEGGAPKTQRVAGDVACHATVAHLARKSVKASRKFVVDFIEFVCVAAVVLHAVVKVGLSDAMFFQHEVCVGQSLYLATVGIGLGEGKGEVVVEEYRLHLGLREDVVRMPVLA